MCILKVAAITLIGPVNNYWHTSDVPNQLNLHRLVSIHHHDLAEWGQPCLSAAVSVISSIINCYHKAS